MPQQCPGWRLFWRLKELNSIGLARPVPAGLRDTSSALSAATGCPSCYLDINKLCWSVTNSRSRWLFFNVCSTDHLPAAQSNLQNDWETAFNPAYIFYAVVVWSISHCKARRSSEVLVIREKSLFSVDKKQTVHSVHSHLPHHFLSRARSQILFFASHLSAEKYPCRVVSFPILLWFC